MESNGTCSDCEKDKLHNNCKQIGEDVIVGQKSYAEYSFYQCSKCGSAWMLIIDGGLGGHARFEHRITKGRF